MPSSLQDAISLLLADVLLRYVDDALGLTSNYDSIADEAHRKTKCIGPLSLPPAWMSDRI